MSGKYGPMMVKEIAYVGKFTTMHGDQIDLTIDLLAQAVEGSKALMSNGFNIRAFLDHEATSSKDVAGTWMALWLTGSKLFGLVQAHGENMADKIEPLDTSLVLEEDVHVRDDLVVPFAITRVDVVPQGAVTGTEPFARLARGKTMTKFRDRIQELREAKSWSLDDFASRVNRHLDGSISASTLGQIERGDIEKPSEDALRGIAAALEISFKSLDSLVGDSGTDQIKNGRFGRHEKGSPVMITKALAKLAGLEDGASIEDIAAAIDAMESSDDPAEIADKFRAALMADQAGDEEPDGDEPEEPGEPEPDADESKNSGNEMASASLSRDLAQARSEIRDLQADKLEAELGLIESESDRKAIRTQFSRLRKSGTPFAAAFETVKTAAKLASRGGRKTRIAARRGQPKRGDDSDIDQKRKALFAAAERRGYKPTKGSSK
jgi:transcriptional regulator with XRE-family HTH domain